MFTLPGRRGLLGAEKGGDPAPAIAEELGRDLACASGVIGHATAGIGSRQSSVEHDVRNPAAGQGGREGRADASRRQDHAVDGLVEEPVIDAGRIGVAVLGEEHHAVAPLLEGCVHRAHQLRVERVPEIGDHGDPAGAAGRQIAAHLVRHVVERGSGPPDAFPRLFADPGILAKGP